MHHFIASIQQVFSDINFPKYHHNTLNLGDKVLMMVKIAKLMGNVIKLHKA